MTKMFRAMCALLGVVGLIRSQCVGPNINVQLPEPYNYEVGTTPDWVITPAVKCGVVQDGFTWGSDPTVAVADAETADLTFTWCWGDCAGGPTQANYVLSHYLASTDKATNSTFHSELSCDLPSSGSVPSSATSFDVSVVCGADFLGTIVMSFLFVDASTGATTLVEFVVRYQCYTPGCSTLCYEHGNCDVLRGLCKCNTGWLTDDCALYVTYPKELCSLQHFNVSYIIPADFNGVNGLGFQIYFTLIRSFITAERRNFATWTTAVPVSTDPIRDQDFLNDTKLFTCFLVPGHYDVQISSNLITIYKDKLLVHDYETCGMADNCSADATCNGHGTCNINSSCECNEGYFGSNCTRGCSSNATHTTPEGTIQSDYPWNGQDSSMEYKYSTTCQWNVDVGGSYDAIEFTIQYLSLGDDTVSIYEADGIASPQKLISTFSGSTFSSDTITVDGRYSVVTFTSTYTNAESGFVLNYKAINNPIPAVGIAFIAVAAAIVLGAAAAALGVLTTFLVRRRRRLLAEAEATPAEAMPASEVENINYSESETTTQMDEASFSMDKTKIDFGLTAKDVFPILEEHTDQITLINNSKNSVNYCFYVPDLPDTFTLAMRPGKGTIGAHHNKTVEIKFMLLYTTTLETLVKLVISSLSGDTMATIYLPLKLVGALSPRLDPNDIELEHTPLASGAFGAVFRGTYRGQVVAVKVVKHQEGLHDAEKQDFIDECNLMHKLHHQYIVGFIGASYVPGKMCVCSELMTHGSLSHYLESDVDIPYLLLLKFSMNIAEAMAYLHSNKILYRDLKCQNVLLVSTVISANINCKLTDFGTARNVENPDKLFRYTNGVGTPIYMAPELLKAEMYNAKADVYSFSLAMWEMWTREEAWSDTICWDIPRKVQKGERPKIPEDCPAPFAQLIVKCWDQLPDNRPEFSSIASSLDEIFTASGGKSDHVARAADGGDDDDSAAAGKGGAAQSSRRGKIMSRKRATASGKVSFQPDAPEEDEVTAESSGFKSTDLSKKKKGT